MFQLRILSPQQKAVRDIAQAERDLYDARKRQEDTQAVIDLHEKRIARLREQYPASSEPQRDNGVKLTFVLPADMQPTQPHDLSAPFVKRVRQFIGKQP